MKAAQEFICDMSETLSMPDIYLHIRKLMENPDAKIDDFCHLVQTDSMLAIRVIRIANSPYFGFHRQANNLFEAISLIGIIQLHDLLLSSLCMRTFCHIPEQLINFKDFWRFSIATGIAARRIAKFSTLPVSNRYFTLGLLLEIGHAVMFVKKPDLASQALLESQQINVSIDEIERQYFGFDYCELGSTLMTQWQLPEVYRHTIEHHLYPERSALTFRTETEILYIAHKICDQPIELSSSKQGFNAGQVLKKGIPVNFQDLIAREITQHADDVFAMLSPPSSSSFLG